MSEATHFHPDRWWLWLRVSLRQSDLYLFDRLGARHADHTPWLAAAVLISRWSWVPTLTLMLFVAASTARGWASLVICLLMAGPIQWVAKRLARVWGVRRPFTLGLSANHLGHSLRPGFPSTHAVVMAYMTAFMALSASGPWPGAGLASLSAITGWARVHAGAHFPMDVLAGWILGALTGLIAWLAVSWFWP